MTSIGKKLNTIFGLKDKRMAAANSTFAIDGIHCTEDTFFVNHNFVLCIKFYGINPSHLQSANRWRS